MNQDEINRAVAWAELESCPAGMFWSDQHRLAARALLALKAERDAAVADARRLDWIERNGASIYIAPYCWRVHIYAHNWQRPTLRAALDAALAADRLAEEATDA